MTLFPDCTVCRKTFKWKGPDPYLLPCLHAVCETCTTAESEPLNCSSCNITFNAETTSFKKDKIRQRLILHLTARHRPTELLCTHEDDGNQAVCWCQGCKEFLCEHCQNMHGSFKSLSSHIVLSISEIADSKNVEDSHCSIHENYILELFDKTCQIPICLKCRQDKTHCWHFTEEISEANKVFTKHLQDQVLTVTDVMKKTLSKMAENNRHAVELDKYASLQRANITNTFETLKSLLDQRKKEITMMFQTQFDRLKSEIADQDSSFRQHHTVCSNIKDYTEMALIHASQSDLPETFQTMKDITNDCLNSVLQDTELPQPSVTFVTQDLCDLKQAVSSFSRIETSERKTKEQFDTSDTSSKKESFRFKSSSEETVSTPDVDILKNRAEEYEPNVYFKPVIDLPDLVEVKTGEEDEDKVFGERARLFSFDADTSQWKERGIGEMKILYNKDTKRYRILMRREQVLKICANHIISKDMKLTPMTSSDRAWCWSAMDFAEEEMKIEKLAIKFKTPELAAKFKESFESCQKKMESQAPEEIGSSEVALKKEVSKGNTKSLADIFKPESGSWNCSGCYCQNDSGKLRCPACNTIKPGAEEEVKKAEASKSPAGISSSGFSIGPGGFKLGGGGGGFSFGKKPEAGGFSFGSPASGGGFSFASKPDQPAPAESKDDASAPKAPVKDTSGKTSKDTSKSLAEVSKPKEGSWGCPGCYCRNDASQLKCPACQTLKPGTKPEDVKSEASSAFIGSGGFKLGGSGFKVGEGSGFSFSPKPATPAKDDKKPEPKSSDASGSLLAEMRQAKDTPDKTTAQASGFSFTPKSGFSFGTPTAASKKEDTDKPTGTQKEGCSDFNFVTAAAASKKVGVGFQFNLSKVSTPVKVKEGEKTESGCPFQFTFSLTPSKSPQGKTSLMSPKSPDDGDYYVNKDDGDSHIYFEPIVSLPEKVDMKTGEEEEITRFEQRAKLFRFHENEWKERGLGTMKILEHKFSHKHRLLMRREQILKVCCNHVITPDLELRPMTKADGKSWVWFAQDFAEEEAKMEHLAIRFKMKEIAEQFKKKFDAAKTGDSSVSVPVSPGGARGGAVASQEEVYFLDMTRSTAEETGDKGNPLY